MVYPTTTEHRTFELSEYLGYHEGTDTPFSEFDSRNYLEIICGLNETEYSIVTEDLLLVPKNMPQFYSELVNVALHIGQNRLNKIMELSEKAHTTSEIYSLIIVLGKELENRYENLELLEMRRVFSHLNQINTLLNSYQIEKLESVVERYKVLVDPLDTLELIKTSKGLLRVRGLEPVFQELTSLNYNNGAAETKLSILEGISKRVHGTRQVYALLNEVNIILPELEYNYQSAVSVLKMIKMINRYPSLVKHSEKVQPRLENLISSYNAYIENRRSNLKKLSLKFKDNIYRV